MSKQQHIYEYEVDPSSETAPAHVVRMVGLRKRVLEIGCGPGSITRILAHHNQCQIIGMEKDPDAIEKAKPYCDKVIEIDLNDEKWTNSISGDERFDVVVAADVLEHLYDPWTTLQRMTPLIKSDGYIVISLPHIGHAAIMACMINGNFEYRDWGLLDRTHIRFFCLENIDALFHQANLKIIEANFVVKPPEETEFSQAWARLSPSLKTALKESPHADLYQIVLKAVPIEQQVDAEPIVLHKTLPAIAHEGKRSWKARITAHLSPQQKEKIRKVLRTLGGNL